MGETPAHHHHIANDPALAEHAAAIYHLAGRVVADAIEIGRRLTDAKRFGPWLKREFRWSEDTAERYMRVADLNKFRPVRNLDLPLKGLYLLAAPSVPEATRDDIIERAASGESFVGRRYQEDHRRRQGPPAAGENATN